MEPIDYLPIFIIFLLAIAFAAVTLLLTHVVGPKRFSEVKLGPYESGMPPVGDARRRFSVKFYLVAMLFILFDIEVVFLYPWAVNYSKLGLFGFAEMMIFIGILLIGYLYVWRKGALEWG